MAPFPMGIFRTPNSTWAGVAKLLPLRDGWDASGLPASRPQEQAARANRVSHDGSTPTPLPLREKKSRDRDALLVLAGAGWCWAAQVVAVLAVLAGWWDGFIYST